MPERQKLPYLLPHDFLAHPAVCQLLLRRKINSDPLAYRDGVEAACQEMYPGVRPYDQQTHIRLLRNFHDFYKEPGYFRDHMDALHREDVRMLSGEALQQQAPPVPRSERASLEETLNRAEKFLVEKIGLALESGLNWTDIRAIYGLVLDGRNAVINADNPHERSITNALKVMINAGATIQDIRGVLGRVRARFPEEGMAA